MGMDAAREPLRRWERWGLCFGLILVALFGALVELRSAYLSSRYTDLDVYLRAAWALRVGEDPYAVTNNRGWHYCYPVLPALVLLPLAEPPTAEPGYVPFPVSVAVWYVGSVLAALGAVHLLARSVQPTPLRTRRWWYDRMLPVYFLIAPIASTLSRGQVNIHVVLLLAAAYAADQRGRRFTSGLWLAGAICVKVIPAFLLLYPLVKRDGRSLAGASVGMVAGLLLLPALVCGPTAAWNYNLRLAEAIIRPALGQGDDASRAKELIEMTATDNQSIQAVLHNYLHPDRKTRPPEADGIAKLGHVLLGGLLTFGSWRAWRRSRLPAEIRNLLLFGALVTIMTLLSPVSHMHYFVLPMPLVVGILAASRHRTATTFPPRHVLLPLIGVGLCFALPMIPVWEMRREAGLPLVGCVLALLLANSAHRWSCPRVSVGECRRAA